MKSMLLPVYSAHTDAVDAVLQGIASCLTITYAVAYQWSGVLMQHMSTLEV